MNLSEEVDQLWEFINLEELPPGSASGLDQFSDESKNALISRVARTLDPPLRGRVLARLALIATDQNKEDLESLFITNLRSPHPQARKISLHGLSDIGYRRLTDMAILSLRDDSDQVLVTACDLLLPKANEDSRVLQFLKDVYTAHKGDPDFHMTTSLLEAHGISS